MIDSPEQHLWRSVLLQALRDIFRGEKEDERRRALAWIHGNSRDFHRVCEMAGVSPQEFRRAVLECLFFRGLVRKENLKMKGIKTMKNQIKLSKTYKDEFRNDAELVQKAKALFMALYSQ